MTLQQLFEHFQFEPNAAQRKAIEQIHTAQFITAGPGSGKTRVLLWRTVNALVFHGIKPEHIFLSTFTEKAARQLKDGIERILHEVTQQTGQTFELHKMYIGTVHALCQRLLADRQLAVNDETPRLLDEVDQFIFMRHQFLRILEKFGIDYVDVEQLVKDIMRRDRVSKNDVANELIKYFNRFTEEMITPQALVKGGEDAHLLARLYEHYLRYLDERNCSDFSTIQLKAYARICQLPEVPFQLITIDEFQDSSKIQERLFFELAKTHRNLCVVGDDDQSLYRFRGATVTNFIRFEERIQQFLGVTPSVISLHTNYRSSKQIVDFYMQFMSEESWLHPETGQAMRVLNKQIVPAKQDDLQAVYITDRELSYGQNARLVAQKVKELLEQGVIEEPNQIAFLYFTLNNKRVAEMRHALEQVGLSVYAPRANFFFRNSEVMAMIGCIGQVIGFRCAIKVWKRVITAPG